MFNSPVSSILRQATRKDGPLNILTFPTHERYETNLCKTGHNFYSYWKDGIKQWNTDYADIPENYHILDYRRAQDQIPLHLDLDLVLSQNKFGQFQVASEISRRLHLPLVSLEHTLPHPDWLARQVEQMSSMRGHVNVFISDYSIHQWDFDYGDDVRVVKHCVDTDLFSFVNQERKPQLLSVVNDWANRDVFCGFNLWRQIVRDDLPVRVVGDNKGISKPASSIDELVHEYQSSLIYLNTSLISPIPTALLEGMACGCCPISTATCMIPEIIEDGVNGYISNNPDVLRQRCEELLNNPEKAKEIGESARQTITDMFSKDRFLSEWNEIFKEASNVTYIG